MVSPIIAITTAITGTIHSARASAWYWICNSPSGDALEANKRLWHNGRSVSLGGFFMDIRQLQFLCALADCQHFGRAAQQCNVTQPTLSMRLRQLEEELGLTLIRRGSRFEGLTLEGERLLPWARQSLRAFQGVQSEARVLKGQLTGTLRLGMVPLSAVNLAPLLKDMGEEAPEVSLQLSIQSAQALLDDVRSNRLDIVLTYLEDVEATGLQTLILIPSRFALLYHPQHFPQIAEATGRDLPLSWSQVLDYPLGLLTSQMRFRQRIEQCLHSSNLQVRPKIEVDSASLLMDYVRQGICCSVFPTGEMHRDPELRLREIDSALTPPTLVLACRNDDERENTRLFMQRAQSLLPLA
ncbi:LysR family transcriptional regulator [Pokkaliibacter sp. CJK22405]|uniref:LysR family transcriptional regulator n=1 Tax=Pokkaliibacter sp. CJK22405 TaxID=3384615 RepID=UPI003985698C